MTLTKTVLAATLVDQLGLSKTEAKDLVEGFYEEICRSLESGESVNLAGFGRFEKDAFTASEELIRVLR